VSGLGAMVNALRRYLRPEHPPADRTRLGVTVWRGSHVDDFDELIAAQPDFVSVKVCERALPFKLREQEPLLGSLAQHNQVTHGWGWHELQTVAAAWREAEAAAAACRRYGFSDYHANLERKWGALPLEQRHVTSCAFVGRLRARAPGVRVWANSFTGPMTAELVQQFDVFEPMLYATRRTTQARHVRKRLQRFARELPELPVSAMIPTGRLDTAGRVWGWWNGRDGWLDLLERNRPYAVNWYRWGLNDSGNSRNPGVAYQIASLRSALMGGLWTG